jgi:predicted nucleic acid-binding protein
MSDALLDTSVLIGWEAGRLDDAVLPERAAISTMTIGELHLGVLSSSDPAERARRLNTLVLVERRFQALPVSSEVARRFAELVATLREAGRRVPVVDTLIAATALAHGLTLYSQDAGFSVFPGLEAVVLS